MSMDYTLPEKSEEQEKIVAAVERGNVLVDAVAGSGKTTTILHIGQQYQDQRMLILTYNSRLKDETRMKIASLNLGNMECHSYHAMCLKYYGGRTDTAIKNAFANNKKRRKKFRYDVIIIDESQDIKPLFFEFVCKIFKDNANSKCKIVILGDTHQSIYKFNCADSRYISLADHVFLMNDFTWTKLTLSESFRITKQMARFVNECLLKENRIRSRKDGVPVNYIYTNMFYPELIIKEIISVLKKGYKYDDIFILAPTVRGTNTSNPICKLSNTLKENHPEIPIFATLNDEEIYDDRVLEGKIFFSTFHSVKGMERKVVFIVGFDASYYEYYAKNEDPERCPNTIYVATTRAKEILTVFHSKTKDYLPFMDFVKIDGRCRVSYLGCYSVSFSRYNHKQARSKFKDYSVSELLRFIPNKVLDQCMELLSYREIQGKTQVINPETMVKTKNGKFECVSDITGIAIPMYALQKIFKKRFSTPHIFGEEFFYVLNDLKFKNNTIQEFLKNAIIIGEKFHGFKFKRLQIDNFTWVSEEAADECTNRLKDLVSENVVIEKRVVAVFSNSTIDGSLDIVDRTSKTVWEIKCVNNLTQEHFIQLGLYAVMWNRNKNPGFSYKLLNLFDNRVFELEIDFSRGNELFSLLLNWKRFGEDYVRTDEEFINDCRQVSEKYSEFDDIPDGEPDLLPENPRPKKSRKLLQEIFKE